jgi:hypothetical protein
MTPRRVLAGTAVPCCETYIQVSYYSKSYLVFLNRKDLEETQARVILLLTDLTTHLVCFVVQEDCK